MGRGSPPRATSAVVVEAEISIEEKNGEDPADPVAEHRGLAEEPEGEDVHVVRHLDRVGTIAQRLSREDLASILAQPEVEPQTSIERRRLRKFGIGSERRVTHLTTAKLTSIDSPNLAL